MQSGGGSIGVDMKIHFGFCRWLFDNQIRVVCKGRANVDRRQSLLRNYQ